MIGWLGTRRWEASTLDEVRDEPREKLAARISAQRRHERLLRIPSFAILAACAMGFGQGPDLVPAAATVACVISLAWMYRSFGVIRRTMEGELARRSTAR